MDGLRRASYVCSEPSPVRTTRVFEIAPGSPALPALEWRLLRNGRLRQLVSLQLLPPQQQSLVLSECGQHLAVISAHGKRRALGNLVRSNVDGFAGGV